jgi:transcriptional regulator with PAS, ATPase and Fis domain
MRYPLCTASGKKWVVCSVQDVTKFVNLLHELNQVRERATTLEKKSKTGHENMQLLVKTKSGLFRQVLENAKLLARTDSTVLILGKAGRGRN